MSCDLDVLRGLHGNRPQLVDADLKRPCNHLQEPPGSRRTLVIHDEINNLALFVEPDSLAVLSSNIQNRPDLRIEIVCSLSVAADLRDVFISKRNADPPVSGRYNPRDIFPLKTCLLKHLF